MVLVPREAVQNVLVMVPKAGLAFVLVDVSKEGLCQVHFLRTFLIKKMRMTRMKIMRIPGISEDSDTSISSKAQ